MCIILIILLCITNYDPLFIHCSYYKFKTYNMTDYNQDYDFNYCCASLSLVCYYIWVVGSQYINLQNQIIILPFLSDWPF